MSDLNIKKLLSTADDFVVTYIVKNSSSRDKLKSHLKHTGLDPFHRIIVDCSISVKGEEIGYRIEAPKLIRKYKGRIVP